MTKKRWAAVAASSIMIGMAQASFFSVLPTPWREFKPALPIAVIILMLNRPSASLAFAGITGAVIDLFAPGVSKFVTAEHLSIVIALAFISETVLTNRSVYVAAALAVLARVISEAWEFIATFVSHTLFYAPNIAISFQSFMISCAWDIAAVSALFFMAALFTRRMLIQITRSGTYDY